MRPRVLPRLLLAFLSFLVVALVVAPSAAGAQRPSRPTAADAARTALRAADSTTTYQVRTRDGTEVQGRVLAIRGDSVVIAATVGTVTIPLSSVVRADPIRPVDMHDGEYWFPNPNTTRLLFAPTGRMLPRGQGYFSDYMIFFPGVAVGITDRVTMGGGMSVIPGLGFDEQLFYLTPKVGLIQRPRLNVAAGVLALRLGLDDDAAGDDSNAGILYTVGTFGGTDGSVTAGIGYGYAGGELADSPALMLGADRRTSRRFGLMTENYVFPELADGALLSAGGRFFGEKMSIDFGFVTAVGDGGGDLFPFVGFVVNF